MNKKGLTVSIVIIAAAVIYYYWMRKKAAAAAQNLGATAGTAAGAAAVNSAAAAAGQIITEAGGLSTPGGTTSGSGTTAGKYNFTNADLEKNLSKGQSGILVRSLQIFLKKAGENLPPTQTAADGIDGVFGTDTENALYSFKGSKTTTLQDLYIPLLELSSVDVANRKIYGKTIFGVEKEITTI